MQIKELTVTRVYETRCGQMVSVSLTASVDTGENMTKAALQLHQLADVRLKEVLGEHTDQPPNSKAKPTDTQWFKLRCLLIKNKGIREDSEVLDYVMGHLGTDHLEWVSYDEMEMLIKELEGEK